MRALAAVGVLALVLASCGGATDPGEETASTTGTVSPTTSTAATTLPPTTTTEPAPASTTTTTMPAERLEDVVGTTASASGWRVEPGRYAAAFDGRNVALDITHPVTYYEGEGRLDFGPEEIVDSPVPDWVRLGTFVGVIPPERAGEHAPHDTVVPTYTADLPQDLGQYLETIPHLQSVIAGQIEGDGFTARAWDITVDPAQGDTFPCFLGDCVSVLVSEFGGVYVFGSDAVGRVWQFEGDGEGVYGYLQSRPESFHNTVALADMLIKSLKFEAF